MSSPSLKLHFPIFIYFLTLTILVQSNPSLLQSDQNALINLHKHLNLPFPKHPCNSLSIFCKKQYINHTSHLRVTRLVFPSQNITGTIPPAIGQLTELKELNLAHNLIAGQVPALITDFGQLEILNLTNNRLSGKLPPGLSKLVRLRILDLSSNQFVGSVGFLRYLTNLNNLNLADNLFSGYVPANLRSFRNLKFVNVSGNSLVLQHSSSHRDYYSIFELTGNNGNTPKRYRFAETSRNGTETNKHPKRRIIGWGLGFVAGILAGCLSGLLFSVLFKLLMTLVKGRDKEAGLKIFSPLIKKPEDLAFLEKEDGLASLDIIGKGGCGEVYKGVLPGSNGKEIAIKKIIQISSREVEELTEEDSRLLNKKMRQVRSEIQTVGQIRHRNLLPLLAHLPRPDCHFLVYEYMKNGSLQDCLQEVTDGQRELDWLARYKIALGIASGLEYLHMNHTPRIIHRDLKPANILLDDEMEARIADFGLAKAVPDAHTHVTTSNVAGTVGYIAPEYYQTFKFTDKCDIYSFGVVLGVLVMGKLPSHDFFQHTDEMSLVKWIRNVMTSEDPKRAIDPRLLGKGYDEQMLLVLKVACFCTLDNAKERPNSKDARCMLSQIKH